jgi:hypothetical protein
MSGPDGSPLSGELDAALSVLAESMGAGPDMVTNTYFLVALAQGIGSYETWVTFTDSPRTMRLPDGTLLVPVAP